jgi:hypothetical protein
MELAQQQKLVARLCTDREFREEFFANPVAVAAHQGLTAGAEGLAELHPERLRQFARLLRTRQLGTVGVALPLTRRVLGNQFVECFKIYALRPPAPGVQRAAEDAVKFVEFLRQHAQQQPFEPAWGLSLARYEAARLEAVWLGRRLVLRVFPHRVGRLVALLAKGSVSKEEQFGGASLAIWCWCSSRRRPRHWIW